MSTLSTKLSEIYHRLLQAYGPQHWWPADGTLEVMVGAVLTQNTTWQGVEKAINNLKNEALLSVEKLQEIPTETLAVCIRPAGYFNLKARRLKNLIHLVSGTYGGSLEEMSQVDTDELRRTLLTVKGVGPETADSILLYGFHRPVFVVDTYTYRVVSRHGLLEENVSYDELQQLFTDHLPPETSLFNEYHALLVKVGKLHCRPKPRCQECPLEPLLTAYPSEQWRQ